MYSKVILHHLILPPDLPADSLLLPTEDSVRALQLRSRQREAVLDTFDSRSQVLSACRPAMTEEGVVPFNRGAS